jgi:type I restriction enzyme S subunit
MAFGNWRVEPFGALIESRDALRVPVKENERRPGPYPYYGASGIVDHIDKHIFEGRHLLIAEDGENLRTRKLPIAFLADGKFWVNNHAHIVRGNSKADTRFLLYALLIADVASYLTGSTMPKLTQGNLHRIPVLLPDIDEQDAIVRLLGSLDDKIELNRRMNATLEAMAQAIFRDWFVDFGPTRRKLAAASGAGRKRAAEPVEIMGGLVTDPARASTLAALFPDALGDDGLPAGWTENTLGQHILNFDSKRVPVSGGERAKRKGPYPYHGATGVMDHVNDFLFDGIYLLVGEDGSVVKESGLAFTQYVWGKIWVNNHAHVLQGKGAVSTEQLLAYFQHEPVAPFITGAVQLKLSQGRMNSMPFIFSGDALCGQYQEIVAPLYARIRGSMDENQTLAATRDLLLPKLMSGEIRLRDAEAIAENAT